MTRCISLLGSTGSIGLQTLDVARKKNIKIAAIAANSNVDMLFSQVQEFSPALAVLMDEKAALELRCKLKGSKTKVAAGIEGLCEAAAMPQANTILTAVVGMIGLLPTLEAIKHGKDIALANKETLVAGGELVMAAAKAKGVNIMPVDSEHSAVFQSLQGCTDKNEISKIILTASGGPFFGCTRQQLKDITPAQALKHPNWTMGAKITIDSATLANKGLEFIEAMHLFGVSAEQIEIVVHRESIVHSMVEYRDKSVIAQLSNPDMRLPIQYALTYPQRLESDLTSLDFSKLSSLSFAKPDLETFTALDVLIKAAKTGGTMPAAVNAANEEAVALFLSGRIGFLDIGEVLREVYNNHCTIKDFDLEALLRVDLETRQKVKAAYEN